MDEIHSYVENSGSFASHHHVINHIDMILGLSDTEKKLDNQDKLVVVFYHDEKKFDFFKTSDLTENDMLRLRKRLLYDSLYANNWTQFMPINEITDDFLMTEGLNNDELEDIMLTAFGLWEEQEGGWENFVDRTATAVLMLNWEFAVVDRVIIEKVPVKKDIDKLPVAINNRRILANRYSSVDSWKTYTERICKNSFIKMVLHNRQNGLCAVCQSKLNDKAVIHHIDYDHKCTFQDSGLDWKVPKTRVQPNCELCFQTHREWCDDCISRLFLVHNNCNYFIDHML